MSIDNASQVLLIIVSTVLALFLILAIAAIFAVLRILKVLKRIINKAEHIADTAESVGSFVKQSAGTVGLAKVVATIIEHVQKSKDKK